MFARAKEYGRERAFLLDTQMKALLGDWRGGLIDLLWRDPRDGDLYRDPLFATELLPLLVRHDRLARGPRPEPAGRRHHGRRDQARRLSVWRPA